MTTSVMPPADEPLPDATDVLPAGGNRRAAPRITLLIRSAKVSIDGREYLCLIKDVSESGVALRLFHRLPFGAAILEIGNGLRYPLFPRRVDGSLMAYSFEGKIDLTQIVEEPNLYPRRSTRISIDLPVTLVTASGEAAGRITNMSQHGLGVDCDRSLRRNECVRIKARGLHDVPATVRWQHNHSAGMMFRTPYGLADFARLIYDIQG